MPATSPHTRLLRLVALVSLGLLLSAPIASGAVVKHPAPVPRLPFLGIATSANVPDLDALQSAHVPVIRFPLDWRLIEPVRGHPDFAASDTFLGAAAERGITALPILVNTPAWAAAPPQTPSSLRPARFFLPRDLGTFAGFASRVVRRYGPGGTFWRANPGVPYLPIRTWQIWNEPNLVRYWPAKLSGADYVRMLARVGPAIRHIDPGARIVTGGIANANGALVAQAVPGSMKLTPYLRELLSAKIARYADGIALHPYATAESGVEALIRGTRALLTRGHARLPIWLTEFGWCTGGQSAFCTGPQEQADRTGAMLDFLVRERRTLNLAGAYLYTWRDTGTDAASYWDQHAGLLEYDGTPRPVFDVFEQGLSALNGSASTAGS